MESFIAMAGTYLTAENIAWVLGVVLGLEQVIRFHQNNKEQLFSGAYMERS